MGGVAEGLVKDPLPNAGRRAANQGMQGALTQSLSAADAVAIVLAVVLAVLVAIIGYRMWQRSRITPEERERMRRVRLFTNGKMGDASVVEVRDDLLFYSYDVRGVEYLASQDISRLQEFMPTDPSLVVGPVMVKFDPRNPANSIVVSEGWSGFRVTQSKL